MPESYHGFDESSFFYLPDIRLPLTVKNQLQVAAVVTDEYGRRIIWAGIPYILNSEDMELTHPGDCTLDSDPAPLDFQLMKRSVRTKVRTLFLHFVFYI